jgi:glycosyltransferase involved in cell wall biosynthesis
MGRMNAQKGQWHLIRAFPTVKTRVPEAQLVILGEGPPDGPICKIWPADRFR